MIKLQAPWWAREGVRYRLIAADAAPLTYELPGQRAVTVSYEDLVKHARGREVAAVQCLSRSFTGVLFGGNKMPNADSLYTGAPRLISLWPGDSLTFTAVKDGGVELASMVPVHITG